VAVYMVSFEFLYCPVHNTRKSISPQSRSFRTRRDMSAFLRFKGARSTVRAFQREKTSFVSSVLQMVKLSRRWARPVFSLSHFVESVEKQKKKSDKHRKNERKRILHLLMAFAQVQPGRARVTIEKWLNVEVGII